MKKPSLKDAFVRNAPSQLAVEPATQEAVSTEVQPLASDTAVQATVATASLPRELIMPPAPQPSAQPSVSPVIQVPVSPVSHLPVYTANPLPVHKKKATFNLDASLHQRLKVAAAVHSREMVDIVEDALLSYLPNLDRSSNQGIAR